MPSLKIDIIVDDKGRPVINQVTNSMKELAGATKQADAAMASHSKTTGSADSSMAGLTRTVLRLYAAYYVVRQGIEGVTTMLMQGVKAIDDYNLSIAKMAAMMTGMMEPNGKGLAEQYRDAHDYAKQLNVMIEQVDKNTLLTASDLRQITEEMMKQGIVVDTNSKKQIDAFTDISNALAVIAAGAPNKEIQLRQEIRALLSGQMRDTDQLSKMLNAQTGDLKGQLEVHKQQGDLIEWLGEQLRGFAAAQGDINSSWEAMKTSLETIYNQILRAGFQTAFRDITGSTKDLSDWATQHKYQIAEILEKGYAYIKIAFYDIKNLAYDVWSIMKGYEPLLRTAGGLALGIADGFGSVYARLKPIAEITGTILAGWLEIVTAIARFNPAALAVRMATQGPSAIWQDAKDTFERGKGIRDTLKGYKINDVFNAMEKGVADRRNYQKETLDALMGSSYDIEGWGGTGKPKLKTYTGDQDKAKSAAAAWAKTIADLRTEVEKANPDLDQFDKKLLDIANKFKDLYAQGAKSKQPTGMLEGLKSQYIDQVLAQKISAEQEAQHEITMIELKGSNERFNLEKENAIKIAQLKAQWGEMSEVDVLKMQRDLLLENLDYRQETVQAEIDRLILQPDSIKNDKELARLNQEMLKIDTERRTTKEYMATQLADKERRAAIQGLEALKEIYSSSAGMAEQAYAIEAALINKRATDLKTAGVDEAVIAQYVQKEKEKALVAFGRKSSSITAGIKAAWYDLYQNQLTWGEAAYGSTITIYRNMGQAFGDSLYDVILQDMEDLDDVWENAWKSSLRIMTNYLGQMASQWLLFNTVLSSASSMGFGSFGGFSMPGMSMMGGGGMGNLMTLGGLGSAAYSLLGGGVDLAASLTALGYSGSATELAALSAGEAAAWGYGGSSGLMGALAAIPGWGWALGGGALLAGLFADDIGGFVSDIGSGIGDVFDDIGDWFGDGGVFSGGRVTPFARGGIVGSPTLFRMADGMGLMGEAGPEAVMPLTRGSDGKLGVKASGGTGGLIIQNLQLYVGGEEFTGHIKAVADGVVVERGKRNISATQRMYE